MSDPVTRTDGEIFPEGHKKALQSDELQGLESGAPEETRTPNLLIRSQTLYPIELRVLCAERGRQEARFWIGCQGIRSVFFEVSEIFRVCPVGSMGVEGRWLLGCLADL